MFSAQPRALIREGGKLTNPQNPRGSGQATGNPATASALQAIFLPLKPQRWLKSRHWWVRLPAVTPLLSLLSLHTPPFTSHRLTQDYRLRCVAFAGAGRGGTEGERQGREIHYEASCLQTIYNKFLLEKDIWLTTVFFCLGMTKYSKNSKWKLKSKEEEPTAGAVCFHIPRWRMTNSERSLLCIPCPHYLLLLLWRAKKPSVLAKAPSRCSLIFLV